MGYRTVSQSASIIDLDKVKKHCFVHDTDDDALLDLYIEAACQRFTESTGMVITQSTIEFTADSFADVVRLYRSPISEVTSIKYRDTEGTEQTLDITNLVLDSVSRPARLSLRGQDWPKTDGTPGNVKITFTAGHANLQDLPTLIEWAILTMVAHMYENREEVSAEKKSIVPSSAQLVINMFEYKDVM